MMKSYLSKCKKVNNKSLSFKKKKKLPHPRITSQVRSAGIQEKIFIARLFREGRPFLL